MKRISIFMLCGMVGLARACQSSALIAALPSLKVTDYDEQALFTAIRSGKPGDLKKATEAVELHMSLSDPSLVNEQGSSPLAHAVAHAADKSVITFLLDKKVPIDYIGKAESSLLDILMTKTPFALLQKRKKLSRCYAAQCPSQYLYDVAFLLLSHNVPCTKDTLKAAKDTCLEDLLKVNWREEDRFGLTPLYKAVKTGNVPEAELLLARGAAASINLKMQWDGQNTCLSKAVSYDNVPMVELLLAHGAGASINASDWLGDTPLYWAVVRNNVSMVELLLAHGAATSIHVLDRRYITPYFLVKNGKNSAIENLFSRYQNQ